MKSGLYKQMEEAKVEDYTESSLTMDMLMDYLMSVASKQGIRKFILGTGKLGVIQYYTQMGISEDTLNILKERLPEGYYEITENGVRGIDY